MSSARLAVRTTSGRAARVENASTLAAEGSLAGGITTTMPCDSIRRTRCVTGPSPRPQRLRSSRAADAGSVDSSSPGWTSPPAKPGRSTRGNWIRCSSAYVSSQTCSAKASALSLGLRCAAQASEVRHGGVEPVGRSSQQEERHRNPEDLRETGNQVGPRLGDPRLVLTHRGGRHSELCGHVLLRHLRQPTGLRQPGGVEAVGDGTRRGASFFRTGNQVLLSESHRLRWSGPRRVLPRSDRARAEPGPRRYERTA